MTQQEIVQSLVVLSGVTQVLPLHLSAGLSIDLKKVVRYEPVEKTETVTVGEGKAAKEVEQGTGVFEPAVFFEGGEFIVLTPEQNEVFRSVWDIYARLGSELFNTIAALYPTAPATADAQEAV